jgi:hypothetical protein
MNHVERKSGRCWHPLLELVLCKGVLKCNVYMLICVRLWLVEHESDCVDAIIRIKVGRKRHMQLSTDGPA